MPSLWGIEGVRKGQMLRQAKGLVSYFIHKLSTFSTIIEVIESLYSRLLFNVDFFFYNSSPLVWWIWRHINLALLSVKIRIDAILLILLIETMCMHAFIIHNRYLKVVNVGTLTLASILGLLLQMYLY